MNAWSSESILTTLLTIMTWEKLSNNVIWYWNILVNICWLLGNICCLKSKYSIWRPFLVWKCVLVCTWDICVDLKWYGLHLEWISTNVIATINRKHLRMSPQVRLLLTASMQRDLQTSLYANADAKKVKLIPVVVKLNNTDWKTERKIYSDQIGCKQPIQNHNLVGIIVIIQFLYVWDVILRTTVCIKVMLGNIYHTCPPSLSLLIFTDIMLHVFLLWG